MLSLISIPISSTWIVPCFLPGDLAASCNYALKTNGFPERSVDEVRRFVGNGVKKLMERAIPDGLENEKFEQVFADFRKHVYDA